MTMNIPDHWTFLLDGLGETDAGDVITRDGEIIGGWGLVDGVFYTFTPDGADEHIFFEPFLGMLCSRIAEWHEERGLAYLRRETLIRRHPAVGVQPEATVHERADYADDGGVTLSSCQRRTAPKPASMR